MSNYLNGYSKPRFAVTLNGVTTNIDLDLTMSKGLIETIEEHSIEHELLNYTKTKSILGYSIHFSLSYDEYSSKENTYKIYSLINAERAGATIVLYPRIDLLSRNFAVIGMNKEVSMGLNRGGSKAMGHRMIELKYTTKYLLEYLEPFDPDTQTTVLVDYDNLIIV